MATINLGKVKGEPFRYEDFTEEQLKALKGKDFKYEDFSPEQLEGLRSKIKVGVVETLDADEQVRVTPRVEGNTTTLDFAIPRGNGVNSYSGTREQYESEKESIKDGSLVNITDENDFEDETLIGADTLRRVFDIESNMANIKPHAFSNPTNNLLATEPGTALDAVQGKVLLDKIDKTEQLVMIPTDLIDKIIFRKKGGVVSVELGKISREIGNSVNQTIAIHDNLLPPNFRPIESISMIIPVSLNTGINILYLGIGSGGSLSVRFVSNMVSGTQLYGYTTYISIN